jgi:Protein of unknown function (DUF2612)
MPQNPYLVQGYGSGQYGNAPIENLPLEYYLDLLTSEYQNSPKFNAFLEVLLRKFDDISQCQMQIDQAFDVDNAVGVQLDAVGAIVGVSRIVPFQPTGSLPVTVNYNLIASQVGSTMYYTLSSDNPAYPLNATWNLPVNPTPDTVDLGFGFTINNNHIGALIINGSASSDFLVFYNIAAEGGVAAFQTSTVDDFIIFGAQLYSGAESAPTLLPGNYTLTMIIPAVPGISPVLDDDTYRIYIKAQAAKNTWDGTIDSLQGIWKTLFPSGQIIIDDNQNMTATIIVTGMFTSLEQDLITNGLIVPRPQGVLYNFVFTKLPIFGLDLDNKLIAGLDTGFFS